MSETDSVDHNVVKPKATLSLIIGVSMAIIGASFQYGYNIAVLNAPADEIKDYYFGSNKVCSVSIANGTNITTCVEDLGLTNYRNIMYVVAVSAFVFGGIIGSFLVEPVLRKFGSLRSLILINTLSFAAALCLGFAQPFNNFALLVFGRVLTGILAGVATDIVPMYIGEISPKEWRGAIGVLNQLLITIGILFAQLLGLQSILGTQQMLPDLLAFTCVPSVLMIISIPIMPKSPRFIFIVQQKEEEARNTLIKLRGTDNVAGEMDEMRTEAASQAAEGQMTIMQLFREKAVRWQLITVLLMMAAQQLSGIKAVFYYSNMIFDAAGIQEGSPQDIASVGVGVINVLMTIVSFYLSNHQGHRILLLRGYGMMIMFSIIWIIVVNLFEVKDPEFASVISTFSVMGFVVGFSIGPGPIPWLLAAELFPRSAHPSIFMVLRLLDWTCNFMVAISFPAIANALVSFVFLPYMFICIASAIYVWVVLPETKGKTLQQIHNMFAKRNKVEEYAEDNVDDKTPLDITDSALDDGKVDDFTFRRASI